jgi:hypothetical protein
MQLTVTPTTNDNSFAPLLQYACVKKSTLQFQENNFVAYGGYLEPR